MADKDVAGVLAALAASPVARAARVVCTEVDLPRALPAARLAKGWAAVAPGSKPVVVTPIGAALERALAEAPGPIVVAGSLYLVGAVRAILVDDPELRDEPDTGDVDAARARSAGGGPMIDAHARSARSRRRSAAGRSPGGRGRSSWGSSTRPRIRSAGTACWPAAPADPVAAALELAGRMLAEGADLLDVGGESTRPGHEPVDEDEERRGSSRSSPPCAPPTPDVPISIDTTKPAVAAAALDAGASLINDVWGVSDDDALVRLAAERAVPIVLMHNRAEPSYVNLMAEIVADLERAIERAVRAGCRWDDLIVDPGFGFGKTPEHNLLLLRELAALRVLGRPILLGTSRKSTLGRVLDLPADERLEATLATTALGIAAGVDIVRVHDVRANVRVARMTDAIVR